MKKPQRFVAGTGPARILMAGSGLDVPRAARRRALRFTNAAAAITESAAMVATGTATALRAVTSRTSVVGQSTVNESQAETADFAVRADCEPEPRFRSIS